MLLFLLQLALFKFTLFCYFHENINLYFFYYFLIFDYNLVASKLLYEVAMKILCNCFVVVLVVVVMKQFLIIN